MAHLTVDVPGAAMDHSDQPAFVWEDGEAVEAAVLEQGSWSTSEALRDRTDEFLQGFYAVILQEEEDAKKAAQLRRSSSQPNVGMPSHASLGLTARQGSFSRLSGLPPRSPSCLPPRSPSGLPPRSPVTTTRPFPFPSTTGHPTAEGQGQGRGEGQDVPSPTASVRALPNHLNSTSVPSPQACWPSGTPGRSPQAQLHPPGTTNAMQCSPTRTHATTPPQQHSLASVLHQAQAAQAEAMILGSPGGSTAKKSLRFR